MSKNKPNIIKRPILTYFIVFIILLIIILVLTSKEDSSLIKNSDFLTFPSQWSSNGVIWRNFIIDERRGIVIIHPVSINESRYIQQVVVLPPKENLKLEVSATDVAGKFLFAQGNGCDDVGMRINLIVENQSINLGDTAINAKEGWKNFSFNLSQWSGKKVTVRVESYAGGPCGSWQGEWLGIDFVRIVENP